MKIVNKTIFLKILIMTHIKDLLKKNKHVDVNLQLIRNISLRHIEIITFELSNEAFFY